MKVFVSMLDKEYYARGEKAVAYTKQPVLVQTTPMEIEQANIVDDILGSNRILIKKTKLPMEPKEEA